MASSLAPIEREVLPFRLLRLNDCTGGNAHCELEFEEEVVIGATRQTKTLLTRFTFNQPIGLNRLAKPLFRLMEMYHEAIDMAKRLAHEKELLEEQLSVLEREKEAWQRAQSQYKAQLKNRRE
jgi:hypothetical protein